MRELVTIHLGQPGVQMGLSSWELLCSEQNILANGEKNIVNNHDNNSFFEENEALFVENPITNTYKARAVFFDLDPYPINNLKNGPYRKLFYQNALIYGKEAGGNNWSWGHSLIGKKHIEETKEIIRKLVEPCDYFEGFLEMHSLSGATGSGFFHLLNEELCINYRKNKRIAFTLFPSPNLTSTSSIIEPYNAVLTMKSLLNNIDASMLINNEALYKITQEKLMIQEPHFSDLNKVIANLFSNITAHKRFIGPLKISFDDILTNLKCSPNQNFFIPAYSSFLNNNKSSNELPDIELLTKQIFDQSSCLASCDINKGTYLSNCLLYRGDINPIDVYQAINNLSLNKDYCKIKLGISNNPSFNSEKDLSTKQKQSVCLISNTTSIKQLFAFLAKKFDSLFKKRAFVHWFDNEIEVDDMFEESINYVRDIIKK